MSLPLSLAVFLMSFFRRRGRAGGHNNPPPSHNPRRALGLSTVALAGLLAACGSEPPKISQVGYFKSGTNDRVISCRMNAGATPEDVRDFAEARPYTAGQLTAVYCYATSARIPADALTQAGSLAAANAALDAQGVDEWRYAYMRYANGAADFVDCVATPGDELCRPN